MAIFYPPPQPYLGGHQPLDTIKLVPIAAAPAVVNDPQFGYPGIRQETRDSYSLVRWSWEPDFSRPYFGASQPLTSVKLSDFGALQPPNPQFGDPSTRQETRDSYNVLQQSWTPDLSRPFVGGRQPVAPYTGVAIPGYSVDNPTFGYQTEINPSVYETIGLSWAPDVSRPFIGSKQPLAPFTFLAPGWSVDNPQFAYPTELWPETFTLIGGAWNPDLTRPFLGETQPLDPRKQSVYPGWSVDNPLFGSPTEVQPQVYQTIGLAWLPDVSRPFLGGRQPLEGFKFFAPGWSVDIPTPSLPFRSTLGAIRQIWEPPAPAPPHFVPVASEPGWSVDNPTFAYPTELFPQTFTLIGSAWTPDLSRPFIGGNQPLDPRKQMLYPGWSVDQPSFAYPTLLLPQTFTLIGSLWAPDMSRPFLGGAQPLDPRKQTLYPGWSVDSPPPFSTVYADVLGQLWLPGPPPPQRAQPTAAIPGWSVDPPPIPPTWVYDLLLQLWIPGPPQPQRGLPTAALPGWSVDQPPNWQDWPQQHTILRAWTPPDPLPQRPLFTSSEPGWSVDTPPAFSTVVYDVVAQLWVPGPPLPQRIMPSASPPGWSVDQPPFGLPGPNLGTIVQDWQPRPPDPQRGLPSVAPPGWSVDAPPPTGASTLYNILVSWLPGIPGQPPQAFLVPIAVVGHDNPPIGYPSQLQQWRDLYIAIAGQWLPDVSRPYFGAAQPLSPIKLADFTALQPPNPPFGYPTTQQQWRDLYQTIAAWWAPDLARPFIGGFQPLDPRKLTLYPGWSVDNPPTISPVLFDLLLQAWVAGPPSPQRSQPTSAPPGWSVDQPPVPPTWAFDVIAQLWVPGPPLPQRVTPSSSAPGWSVDQPPVAPTWAFDLLAQLWLAAPPLPQSQRPSAAPPGWSVDQPPILPTWAYDLLLQLWVPGPPGPQQQRPTAAPPGWSVDIPLQGIVHNEILYTSWVEPRPPAPQRPQPSAAPPGWSVDTPPFGVPNPLWDILLWQPAPPMPQRLLPVASEPGWSIDNPPIPPTWVYDLLLQLWVAAPPAPQRPQPTSAPPGWSVDQPPLGLLGANLGTILEDWQPAPPSPPQGLRTASEPGWSVDNPPPQLSSGLYNVLVGWLPSAPGQQPRPFYVPVIVSPVNDPPFGVPNPQLWAIVASWQPGPGLPQVSLYVPQGAPPSIVAALKTLLGVG